MAGNANSGRRKNTFVTDAILMEIKAREKSGDVIGLRKMAVTIMDLAEEGERWAAEFIRDTIDGKPMQQVEFSGSVDTKPTKLTDEELEHIATTGSAGVAASTESQKLLN